jgi:uncharacterized protein (TIGR03066 family)
MMGTTPFPEQPMIRLFAAVAAVALAAPAYAEEKYKAEDLLGKWSQVMDKKRGPETSVTFTIHKDGTFLAEIVEGKEVIKSTGKWKLEGDAISITHDKVDKPGTMPILKLTADTLVVKDVHGEETFKKVKDEKK